MGMSFRKSEFLEQVEKVRAATKLSNVLRPGPRSQLASV